MAAGTLASGTCFLSSRRYSRWRSRQRNSLSLIFSLWPLAPWPAEPASSHRVAMAAGTLASGTCFLSSRRCGRRSQSKKQPRLSRSCFSLFPFPFSLFPFPFFPESITQAATNRSNSFSRMTKACSWVSLPLGSNFPLPEPLTKPNRTASYTSDLAHAAIAESSANAWTAPPALILLRKAPRQRPKLLIQSKHERSRVLPRHLRPRRELSRCRTLNQPQLHRLGHILVVDVRKRCHRRLRGLPLIFSYKDTNAVASSVRSIGD